MPWCRPTTRLSGPDKRRDERQTLNTGNTSHAENPPLVRVRLNRLLGILLVFCFVFILLSALGLNRLFGSLLSWFAFIDLR